MSRGGKFSFRALTFWRSRRRRIASARRPASSLSRPFELPQDVRGSGSRLTTARSRTSWVGSGRRCSSTRVVTAARRRWRGSRILVGHRAASFGFTSTAAHAKVCRLEGSEVVQVGDEADVIGRVTSAAYHYELGPIALAVVKYTTADDASVSVRTSDVDVPATMDAVVERDSGPRPGQVARAAFRTLGVR